ncbi:S9 family peptidase [Marinigracilibium pacificum]|uniref:S9 family peptidase n=1 Tax=Marinigracilibium pacificum TaxID=2729599 RepID=A0A848IWE4_9BACT|nr:S9 family peptidase [Marinigracilibium pacificum]NMM47581.1 S9 family peptidase [Marinigracilibium pacificum]
MRHLSIICLLCLTFVSGFGQNPLSPEKLWTLGRVSGMGISNENVIFAVSHYSIDDNSSGRKYFRIPLAGGSPEEIKNTNDYLSDKSVSPDNQYRIEVKSVKVKKVTGKDYYPELDKSNVYIYETLNYRHWDQWEDGEFDHIFLTNVNNEGESIDLLEGLPYDCPTKPFGGSEDYIWSPDGSKVLYVTKKSYGTDYAVSTNTDIYEYDINTGKTINLTENNKGYDTSPQYSSTGALAWLQMIRDGYESDKNDIIVQTKAGPINLTSQWDGTVNSFHWAEDGKRIYFIAPVEGTTQLFSVDNIGLSRKLPSIKQITNGDFNISGIVGQTNNTLVVSRTSFNRASELYTIDLKSGDLSQLTHVNDDLYENISESKVEKRYVKTTDGKEMLVWVIYPPGFDKNKKYPTLLYCQGGPQSALTQFYSYRWNFQLMAANGYIVVAPNRRGMPGYGVKWNEQISKDHGGQAIQDYLSAIDDLAKEPYVDKDKLGCVGASYGGYSVFMLAGIHENRFKSFIAHDGIFNTRSMYGTTEELFFLNWDYGGPYWKKDDPIIQKAYNEFNPVNYVSAWDTPMLIIQGGLDFRVPIGQGLEAFQAAQLQGIKSKLLYFPEENHWVLSAQNGIIWQKEFYKWLDETLK